MKAKLVDSMPSGNWIYEVKFDCYRALALRGGSETRILSRNQKDLGSKFPEVKDSVAPLDIQDAIIDGEIVALDERGRSPVTCGRCAGCVMFAHPTPAFRRFLLYQSFCSNAYEVH